MDISVAMLIKALGGKRIGNGCLARCPAHDDREPSLSISTGVSGKVLVRCHAGCTQEQVISALRTHGLWSANQQDSTIDRRFAHRLEDDVRRWSKRRRELAHRIWKSALPPHGTLVEVYLRSRGLILGLTPTLRFHPSLKHPSGRFWPAMVASVTSGEDGELLGIHRTFLARDGVGKAQVEPTKMMLGPCRDGVVRLAEPGKVLMIGEGVETCLAAMQATGNAAWAALSSSGLRTLHLPDTLRDLIILADGDDAGETAAAVAATRWMSEGRRVRIARPPRGMDFNDLLKHRLEAGYDG
jgi:hypothetical protein